MSFEGNAPTGNEPQDRKDILLEQFNKLETEQAESTDAAPAADAPADGGRARDASGKFVAKEKETAPASVDAGQPAQAAPAAPVQLEPWQSAPKSWKKELWEGFTKLDPAYQRYVHEREQQMRSGIDDLIPKGELADKISKAAEPYMNTIRGLGMDLPTAVGGLMKVDNDLRTLPYEQKLQVLVNVARSYGIDLTGQAAQAQPTYAPEMQSVQNELLAIKGQWKSYQEQQEAAQQRAMQEELQAFATKAEHFETVKPLMAQLLQGGAASSYQDAYDKAIRLTPEIFDQIQRARQATEEAEKKKAADEAAKRAKAAAVSVKTSTPGSQKPNNAQDRRSMLREQFDSLSERL